ncbi:MAG: hypothetical protein ACLVEL_02755 [Ruthenibacterium sp.]
MVQAERQNTAAQQRHGAFLRPNEGTQNNNSLSSFFAKKQHSISYYTRNCAAGEGRPGFAAFIFKLCPERRIDARRQRFLPAGLAPGTRKKPGQNCPASLKRQFLMQGKEAFRRQPLRLSGKSEEAMRKNRLPGATLSCGNTPDMGVFYKFTSAKLVKITLFW